MTKPDTDRGRIPLSLLPLGLVSSFMLIFALPGLASILSGSEPAGSALRAALLTASLVGFAVGGYLVWPSRLNVPAHIQLGFAISAYVVPILFLEILTEFPPAIVDFYTQIMLRVIAYIVGLLIGSRLPSILKLRLPMAFTTLRESTLSRVICRRTALLLSLAILGIALSFVLMGFVPILAADPLAAKYFRGEYQEPYRRAAILHRSSFYAIATLLPIALIVWYQTRRRAFLIYPFFLWKSNMRMLGQT